MATPAAALDPSPPSLNICPMLGEHGLIVGKTGSGKTTTFVHLGTAIRQSYPLLCLDSKGDATLEKIPGAVVISHPRDIRLTGVEIYRPDGAYLEPDMLDAVLSAVFRAKRSLYVYVDELYQVSPQSRPGPGLADCLMRGRYRTVNGRVVQMSIVMSSQRPAWIPRHSGTESTHYYIHRLMHDDSQVMSGYVGSERIYRAPVVGHEFYYYNHRMAQPEKKVLHLGGSDQPADQRIEETE